jgi:hypothetical protein
MQKINYQQIRGQQPQPQPQPQKQPQFNIPKTPEQLFLKNKDTNHAAIPAAAAVAVDTSLKTVKYIDDLYTKQFLDEYFTI